MRFRLRTILAVVAILACCLAWLNVRAKRNRDQREAVQTFWRMGGGVAFAGGSEFEQPSGEPNWMVEFKSWIKDAIHGRNAWKLILADWGDFRASASDDDIPRLVRVLKAMPEVEEVRIRNTGITPEGASRLRREVPGVHVSFWSTNPSALAGEHKSPQALVGRWTVMEVQNQGVTAPSEIESEIEFTRSQAILRLDVGIPELSQVFNCFVVPGQDPLKLDLRSTTDTPGLTPQNLRCIYRVEGDDLWICLEGDRARHRPIEFVSSRKNKNDLYRLSRKIPRP
ncbi:putative secreted protein [Rhodopirellula europaea 6C]|uniref:Putative secreted protein n=2 Tax=Rhodopirellula TaxID=265488 RepID=M2AA63_9BACT|nr:putative secreted protein [Rhodopirellula europaea 6C]